MDRIRKKYAQSFRPGPRRIESQESEETNEEEIEQIMKFWVMNLCKDCIDRSRWKHTRYLIPKSIELTEEEKFNMHELYTYEKLKWMAEAKSVGVTAPFYDNRCSFGEKALSYDENAKNQ